VGLKLLLDSVGRSGSVHGVEVSDTMLKQAARRYRRDVAAGRLTLHDGSLTRLPFADGTINGVVTVNTIYFVAELQEAFAELARVTAHSGRIVVGVADPETMAKLPFTGHGFRLRPLTRGHQRPAKRGFHRAPPSDQCRRRGTPPVDRYAGLIKLTFANSPTSRIGQRVSNRNTTSTSPANSPNPPLEV
jgi:SAM-dependent methyltransferase